MLEVIRAIAYPAVDLGTGDTVQTLWDRSLETMTVTSRGFIDRLRCNVVLRSRFISKTVHGLMQVWRPFLTRTDSSMLNDLTFTEAESVTVGDALMTALNNGMSAASPRAHTMEAMVLAPPNEDIVAVSNSERTTLTLAIQVRLLDAMLKNILSTVERRALDQHPVLKITWDELERTRGACACGRCNRDVSQVELLSMEKCTECDHGVIYKSCIDNLAPGPNGSPLELVANCPVCSTAKYFFLRPPREVADKPTTSQETSRVEEVHTPRHNAPDPESGDGSNISPTASPVAVSVPLTAPPGGHAGGLARFDSGGQLGSPPQSTSSPKKGKRPRTTHVPAAASKRR